MKKILLAYLSLTLLAAAGEPAGAVVAATASQIRAEDGRSREVILVNARDEYVFYIHATAVGARGWEEDLLGHGKVLAPGAAIAIDLWDGTNACNFDIKVIWRDKRAAERWNLNACEELLVTFR